MRLLLHTKFLPLTWDSLLRSDSRDASIGTLLRPVSIWSSVSSLILSLAWLVKFEFSPAIMSCYYLAPITTGCFLLLCPIIPEDSGTRLIKGATSRLLINFSGRPYCLLALLNSVLLAVGIPLDVAVFLPTLEVVVFAAWKIYSSVLSSCWESTLSLFFVFLRGVWVRATSSPVWVLNQSLLLLIFYGSGPISIDSC